MPKRSRRGRLSSRWAIRTPLPATGRPAPVGASSPIWLAKPGRRSTRLEDKLYHYGTLIQTDAKLNLGTSGGALVNLKGEMVGLTTSLAATPGYEQAAGYAVPVDETFRRVVDTLKEGREVEYGFLGVAPDQSQQARNSPRRHTGADYARRTGLAGRAIEPQAGRRRDAGQRSIGVRRRRISPRRRPNARRFACGIDSAARRREAEDSGRAGEISRARREGGDEAGAELARDANRLWHRVPRDSDRIAPALPDPGGSVVVLEVDKDSPAAAAGLRYGMFITQVGNTPVRTPKEFFDAVAGKTGEVSLRLSTLIGQPDIRTVKPPAP